MKKSMVPIPGTATIEAMEADIQSAFAILGEDVGQADGAGRRAQGNIQ